MHVTVRRYMRYAKLVGVSEHRGVMGRQRGSTSSYRVDKNAFEATRLSEQKVTDMVEPSTTMALAHADSR